MAFTPCNRYGVAGIIDDEGRQIVGSDTLHAALTGRLFRFSHRFTAVAVAAAVDVLIDPSANGALSPIRLAIEITTGADCSIAIYETPTVTKTGTELAAYNVNRNHDPSMNSVPAVYHTPTISAAGTLAAPTAYVTASLPVDVLYQGVFGDVGAGDAAVGALPEIFINRTKKYLIRVTNIGTGAGNIVVSGRLIREPNYYEG